MELKPWLKHYENGVPNTIDINSYNCLPDILEESFSNFRNFPCFYNMGTTYTYEKIDLESRTFASVLP
jgi:long-chain acyl-CoA synthetase